ncbi:MAG: GAF domain-containing protein, partial [Anaerovoracaceae bacterium]
MNQISKNTSEQEIHSILADLGTYYDADRAVLFEWNALHTEMSSICQWHRDGMSEKTCDLQHVPADRLSWWIAQLEEKGKLSVFSQDPAYEIAFRDFPVSDVQEGSNLMAAALVSEGETIGLLCLVGSHCDTDDLRFLSVAASACCSQIMIRRMMPLDSAKPEDEGFDRGQIVQAMSEIYTSAYYIDMRQNQFVELSSVTDVHAHIGASGDAQERLRYFCHNMITSEFLDEMLEFVNLSTLDERMGEGRIISKEYQSIVFFDQEDENAATWRQCSFIEGDRDADGKLAHVIFTTQSIHETKRRELEAQKKLQDANTELTQLLAAEKQHTAIINSLGNVFSALFYVDLEENTFQEIISGEDNTHVYGEKGDARETLKHMTDAMVADAHGPIMRGFMDFDTIDVRLGSKSVIIQEFADRKGGWTRCSFIPVWRDENGRNRTVIFSLRNITSEKEELASQDNLIQALAIPYENIYAVNEDTGEAVCYRMGQTMSDRYGEKFAAGNYEKNITSYIENDVLEEDRHLFDAVRTADGVHGLLSDKKTFYFN